MTGRTKPNPTLEVANADKRANALGIWEEAQAAAGSTVETYLRSRGLTLPIPPSLRVHPRLKHPCGTYWPAMVALVTHAVTGEPVAIHRTFLAPDGHGKAPVEPNKMMLGPTRGGVVRLAIRPTAF